MTAELRTQLESYLDEYRSLLHDSLNGLAEEEARRSLVPSKTTLLGLVKHVTYVEGVWFDPAISGRTYAEIGIATTPDSSFTLAPDDSIAATRAAYRDMCAASRHNVEGMDLDMVVSGRGERPLWRIYLHMLRELVQHLGHADILREQIVAARGS